MDEYTCMPLYIYIYIYIYINQHMNGMKYKWSDGQLSWKIV